LAADAEDDHTARLEEADDLGCESLFVSRGVLGASDNDFGCLQIKHVFDLLEGAAVVSCHAVEDVDGVRSCLVTIDGVSVDVVVQDLVVSGSGCDKAFGCVKVVDEGLMAFDLVACGFFIVLVFIWIKGAHRCVEEHADQENNHNFPEAALPDRGSLLCVRLGSCPLRLLRLIGIILEGRRSSAASLTFLRFLFLFRNLADFWTSA